jgi:hypothetical protein
LFFTVRQNVFTSRTALPTLNSMRRDRAALTQDADVHVRKELNVATNAVATPVRAATTAAAT